MKTPPMSEADFQKRVLDLAKLCRWRAVHIRPVAIGNGRWATPYQGDAGLPDLILARDGRVILVELKTDTGKPSLDQKAWLTAAGLNGYLWSPKDWAAIETTLKGSQAVAA